MRHFKMGQWLAASPSKIKIILYAVFTGLVFSLNYGVVEDEVFEAAVGAQKGLYQLLYKLLYALPQAGENNGIVTILTIFFCIWMYQTAFSMGKLQMQDRVLGVLMAFTFLFGKSFEDFGTTIILVTGIVQVVKTLLIFAGYLLFFPQCVKVVRCYLRKNLPMLQMPDMDHPVKYRRVVFVIMLAVWSLHVIAYYPGMFMGDTEDIIYMAYNYHTALADTVELISEDVLLVDHHSVLYTIILGFFVKLGRFLFQSENIGIFIYTVLQVLFTAWVLAYSLYQLKKCGVNAGIRGIILLFFCFFPWVPRYAMMATKDTLFADFLLLYLLQILDIIERKEDSISILQWAAVAVYAVLIFLLRKNGLYAVLLSLPFLLIINKRWIKMVLAVLVCVFLSKFLYSDVILPAAKITDGSVSAALSIPLQQTSRYLKYYGDEVTEEEKAAINAVAQYDALPIVYWANRSDWAKGAWRKEADGEDMKNYFIVWAKMLFKHPLTYVAATANNYYGYFYPVVMDLYEFERSSDGGIGSVNSEGYFHFAASDSRLSLSLRQILKLWDTILMKVPLVNLLCTSAIYVWILVFTWTRSIVKKDKKLLMLVIPMLMLMLTILSGPCNGNIYHRFTYPVAMCIPIVAGYGLRSGESKTISDDR
jgi:hypothetical protein